MILTLSGISRGELDQAAAMEVAEFNNIASDVDSDVDAGISAADRSSEQDVPPGDQQLQEKFHSELSDFEDDDASLEAPITTVSRRRLRMVIDVEEDE
ncbi:hypothetical protein BC332_08294 [Capsicum chinense]|nr:hypothetical protein BC332_08294 [Capsicum chinense]